MMLAPVLRAPFPAPGPDLSFAAQELFAVFRQYLVCHILREGAERYSVVAFISTKVEIHGEKSLREC
jgi:hypothetical protein